MNGKLLREKLDTGQYKKVLLYFHHGLGDAIDFYYNVLPVVKRHYPNVEFYFDTHMGQEEFFGNVPSCELFDYDIAMPLVFPCAEWDSWSDETKAEKCLRIEFGIEGEKQGDNYDIPHYQSPLIGVHFLSTSSKSIIYPESDAKKLWNAILDRGFIPIDTHFAHPKASVLRHAYSFENRNVDDIEPHVKTLFGLLGALSGFAGVSSGNFWSALGILHPKHILYIDNEFPAKKLTHLPVHHMKGYDAVVVKEWLDDIEDFGDGLFPNGNKQSENTQKSENMPER